MATAPTGDDTLTPDDAVDVLEELLPAQNQSYELGLKLKVPEHEVESIHSTYAKPRNRLLHVLIAFTKQAEPRPTWRVIVDALRSRAVNLPHLAERVEAAHFPNLTATRDVPPQSTVFQTPITVQLSQQMSATAETGAPSEMPASPKSRLLSSREVQAEIEMLEKRFDELKHRIRECLESYEIAVKRVADALTSLPADDKAEHKQFLESHVSALFKAANHSELFGTMNFHWDYLNYPLLDHLIRKFDLKEVKGEMEIYKDDIQQFREKTPLTLFCRIQKRRRINPPSDFKEMVAEFDWPDDVTLEVVERFRQEYACHYGLHECAMMLAVVRPHCFVVTWFIPESIVEKLKEKVPRAILKNYLVTRLEIAGTCVHHLRKQQQQKQLVLTEPPAVSSTSTAVIGAASAEATCMSNQSADKQAPEEDYLFVEQPSDDLFCPVTTGLLLQPHLTSCCGKHLSVEAAVRIQRERRPCPLCNEPDWSSVLNKHFQRQVNGLRVFCRYDDRGCGWQGELGDLERHVQSCPMRDGPPMTELLKYPLYSSERAGYEKTSSQQYKIMELNEGHLRDIQNKLWPARSQWYNIGLGLGLSPDTLDFIDQDNQGADAKFRYMILKWLRGGKECSWEALCEAVSDPSVDRGALASSILQELCPKTFEPKAAVVLNQSQIQVTPPVLKEDIRLREYQKELAQPGLNGENYILVAPTGTGKTLIAAYIIVNHLKQMKGKSRQGKVAFVAPTRQLTFQQKIQLQQYIPGIMAVDITGANSQPMYPLLQSGLVDVIVCTAGKLRQELKTKGIQITDFSLIIADECHHAGRPSNYTDAMEFYIRLKLAECTQLPQVVGMTASPGAGRGKTNIVTVMDHHVSLCANLDAMAGIVIVRRNVDELERIRNDPKPYLEVGDERNPDDPLTLCLISAMQQLESVIGNIPYLTRGSSKYESWLQNEKEAAENRVENETEQISILDQLMMYSRASMTYHDFRYEDAVEALEEIKEFQNHSDLGMLLNSVHKDLMKSVASVPKIPNPLLVHMEKILLDQFSKCPDSKGIFFVQAVKHTKYVTNWIQSSPSLSQIIRVAPITGYSRGGMEKSEQLRVLEGFRNNIYNLLASTSVLEEGLDVPQCNFVIRYQNVSNEIAQVQAKGRARAVDSRIYTVVSTNSRKDYWYLVQEEKQRMVEISTDALQQLELEPLIWKKQKSFIEQRDLEARQKKILRRRWPEVENVEVRCKRCNVLACKGSDLFMYTLSCATPQYVVPSRAFGKKYEKFYHDRPEVSEDFVKPYKIYCRSQNCRSQWGIIGLWRETEYKFPVLKCDKFLFKYNNETKTFRKWKDIWFEIKSIQDWIEFEDDVIMT